MPVDRRTAADARSGENREGQIARGRRRALEVESLHPDDLALVELPRLIARSLLEHDDTHPRACQLGGDNATAGTRSDDTRVRLQVYRRVDVRERERLAACRHVRHRHVADSIPCRIRATLVHQSVKQKRRESLHSLESLSRQRDGARRHREQHTLPLFGPQCAK